MKIIKKIDEWRAIYSTIQQQTIGLVPTMGYLHAGHLSLVEQARVESDVVVMSIFVNPLQFGVNEDLASYPRDLARDAQLAEQAGVDYIFAPEVAEMYPSKSRTLVQVEEITDVLCGKSRPGHFTGVATVVSKLFHIIQPTYAYFGIKDAQQVAVIEQMVHDLNMPVQLRACPLIREADGLALSSRNVYLSSEERKQALVLFQALRLAEDKITSGERNANLLQQELVDYIQQKPLANIDYVEIRTYPELQKLAKLQGRFLIALAVRFGSTRLIDNLIMDVGN